MSAARRGAGSPPPNAAVRGGALILAAVLVGALLLARGFDDEGGIVAAGPDETATDTTVAGGTTDTTAASGTTDTTATGDTTDTTAAVEVRPNEEIRFTVLNGTTSSGAAATVGTSLSALNYVQVAATNVPGGGGAELSAVYFVDGWAAEAQKVATDLTGDPAIALPIEQAPFEFEMGEATVLVVLGTDGIIAPS